MTQVLRQSTQVVVRVGPFVDVTDGFTPETGVTLSGADEAELLKAAGAATVSIAGNTWAAVTGADGWYDLTLSTTDTNTIGTADVVVNDDSVCLPVFARFQVVEEAAYDAFYAASADPKADINVASIDAGAITATAIATGAIDADALAADAVAEIADGVWDEDATGHQTQGTFGQAIGDPAADTNTIFKAVVTDATGATVGVDAAAILADTGTDGVIVASLAAGSITATVIADSAIDANTFAAGAITAAAIADGAIDAATFAAGAITATVIATGAIDADAIASDAITAAKIADGAIDAGTFAAGAIDAAAIATDAFGALELAAGAASEIADAVWDEARSGHTTTGTFGEYVNIDTETVATALIAEIQERGVSAGAAGAFNSTDVDICNMALDLLKEAPIDALTDGTPEANWLSRNYSMARDAELRDHPWKFAIKRRKLEPLDFVFDDGMSGTLTGAWGLLRLTPSWSGDLVKIRRSSDDTTDTFTNAEDVLEVDTDDIGTFIGTGSGYIDTLYDQSGNGRDLSQATTAKQPLYDSEIGDADVPGFTFDGSNDILSTSAALSTLMSTTVGYMIVVGLVDTWTLDSSTASANHVLAADSTNELGLYVRKGGRLYGVNDDGSEDATTDAAPLDVPFVAEWRHTGGTVYSRVNMGTERSATSGATASVAGTLNLGDDPSGSQALTGSIFAVLTFSSIPTEAERDRMVERLMRWVGAGGAAEFSSDWLYRYPIPSDCLRPLHLRTNGAFEGTPVKHEVESNYILTNESSVYLRYVSQFTDSTRFDPLFTEALTAKLAFKGAHWLTGKATMAATVKGQYDAAIARARIANSFLSSQERADDDEVIDVRSDPYNLDRY